MRQLTIGRKTTGGLWPALNIPTHIHVIHSGGNGKVSDQVLDEQLAILNSALAGANITFTKASVQFVDRPDWFTMRRTSDAERAAKNALGRSTRTCLNFYTADTSDSGAAGWALSPWKFQHAPQMDGTVVNHQCLPGGQPPFNRGGTATHEVGHWLGLHHTYENACNDPGDEVDDTPFQGVRSRRDCIARDSCAGKPGADPIHNYMDTSHDDCRNHFTPGQFARIRDVALPQWRPWLNS